MCDSFNETLKLQQQDKVRLSFYILQHIHKLNAILKCSVCFELFDKPTKTNCGHVFCKSCIYKHMTFYSDSIAPCPICMQPLAEFKKFSLHLKYEEAAKFVKDVLKHGKNLQKDIEDPPNFKSILQIIEQIKGKSKVEVRQMKNFESDVRFNRILKSRNCLISTSSQVFLSDTSAILPSEPIDDIKTIPQISNLQSEVNPFDLLVNESKGLKPTKTYKPQKIPQKDTTVTTEIEKSLKNRKRLSNSKAFEWLQDTRNNFESLPTQLKSTTNLKVTVPEFDLPSISQDLKLKIPSKSNQIKIKRLTRSMGGGSSKITQAKTRERHSIAACDNLSIPITIEQFSGNELKASTKGLQDLELQCLDKMEKELLKKEGSNKKTTELTKSGKNKKGKNLSNSNLSSKSKRGKDTLSASSSLDKFKEIKKVISKTERKVKKLPIVVNPNPTVCKVVTSTARTKDLGDQPFVIIEKCNLMNDQPAPSGSKRKIDKINVTDNDIYNFAKPPNKRMTRIDYVNKNNELQEFSRFETPDKIFNENEKLKRTPGLKIKSSKIKNVDSSSVNGIESENTNILSEQTKEIEIKENDQMEHKSDIDESIFEKLTQSMDKTVIRINTSNIDDDIFNIPTQRISIEPHKVTSNYDESHKKFEELTLLQLSNEIMNRASELKPTAKVHISNLMNDILKAIDTSLPLNQEMSNMVNDVFVQTSSPITNLVNMAVQTDPSSHSFEHNLTEMGIQTDSNSFRKGLYISSTDMFNTPSVTDAEIQTDLPVCLNCNHQMRNSGTKAPERCILSSNKISHVENRASPDVLSPTCKSTKRTFKRLRSQISTEELFAKDDGFDNMQFDTQEILKDKSNLRAESPASSSCSKSSRRTSKRLSKPSFAEQLLEKDDGFDNVQFDTQEILKDKSNLRAESPASSSCSKSSRRTSKRLSKPSFAEQLLEKDDGFDNVQFDTQEILKDKSNLRVGSPASSSCSKSSRRISKPLSKPSLAEQLLEKDDGFDNVQFDTQEILKDKSNLRVESPASSSCSKSPRRTSKRLSKPSLAEQLLEKDDGFDNVQFDTQEILKDRSNLRVESPASSSCSKSPRRTSKRLSKPSLAEQLLEKDDGFDNVQFDTQEILKGNKNCDMVAPPAPSSSSKSPRRTSKRLFKPNLTEQLLEKDEGFDTVQFKKTEDILKDKYSLKVQSPFASPSRRTSKRLRILSSATDENFEMEDVRGQGNLKEHSQPGSPISSTKKNDVGFPSCDSPRRTSKRLRTPTTPDDELLPKDVKRNKYLNEDTSLQFLSDDIVNSNHLIKFDDSDSSKYEECLNNVMKKYEHDDACKSPKKISQVISTLQNAIKECNVIINEACSESIRIENTENLDKTVKYTKQKPSPLTLSILQDEFTKTFDNVSNIVKTSEIPKDVLQLENVELINEEVPSNLGDNFEEIDILMEDVANDASESTNIERLPDNAAQIHTKSSNDYPIVVLQNIMISKEKDDAITEELNRSDEVFLSDSDVVETTPQKSKVVSCEDLLSQAYCNYFAPLVLPPPLVEDSPDVISSLDPPLLTCLNTTFAPPAEFQDMADPEDNLEDSQDVTLKPETDSMPILHDGKPILSSVTPDLFMGRYNMITSTPAETSQIISHSLNLSPIRPTCQVPSKLQNAIEAAQSSMISPLNIVKSQANPQPKNIRPLGSSTPKQQSILSYVRNKKPCVTCSRLNKTEVAMIIALAEKNLITYTTNFNSSVTHLIVNIDEQQCICDHTMKFLCGISTGIWILGSNWIQECITHEQIISEEQYEVLDISGIDGPKHSRLNRISNPLFQGYKIFVAPPFKSALKKDIEDVIINLGGEVVPKGDDLLKKNGKICVIIAEAKGSSDLDMYKLWLKKLKVVTVDMEWLSRSVGQYEIINFRQFILCPEENICDLGYPNELTTNLPLNSCSTFSNM